MVLLLFVTLIIFNLANADSIPLSISEIETCHEGVCTVKVYGHSLMSIHSQNMMTWTLNDHAPNNESQHFRLFISEAFYDFPLDKYYVTSDFIYTYVTKCECPEELILPWTLADQCHFGHIDCPIGSTVCEQISRKHYRDNCFINGGLVCTTISAVPDAPVDVFKVMRPSEKIYVTLYKNDRLVDKILWNGLNEVTLRADSINVKLPKSQIDYTYDPMVIYRDPHTHKFKYEEQYNEPGKFDLQKMGWFQGGIYPRTTFRTAFDVTVHDCVADRVGLVFNGYSINNNTRNYWLDDVYPNSRVYDIDAHIKNDLEVNKFDVGTSHFDIDTIDYQNLRPGTQDGVLYDDEIWLQGSCKIPTSPEGGIIEVDSIDFAVHPSNKEIVIFCNSVYGYQENVGFCGPDECYIKNCAGVLEQVIHTDDFEGTYRDYTLVSTKTIVFEALGTDGVCRRFAYSHSQDGVFVIDVQNDSGKRFMTVPMKGELKMDIIIEGKYDHMSYDVSDVSPVIRLCRFDNDTRQISFEAKSTKDEGFALVISSDHTIYGNSIEIFDNFTKYYFAARDLVTDTTTSITLSADGNQVSCDIVIFGINTTYHKSIISNVTDTVEEFNAFVFDIFASGWESFLQLAALDWWWWLLIAIVVGIFLIGLALVISFFGVYLSGGSAIFSVAWSILSITWSVVTFPIKFCFGLFRKIKKPIKDIEMKVKMGKVE